MGDWQNMNPNRELNSMLDDLIQFESITYHETEAQRHQRKAKVHGEKAEAGLSLGGYAAAAGLGAHSYRFIREPAVSGIRKVGDFLSDRPATDLIGRTLLKHPRAVFTGAAFAPAAALIGYGAAHKVANWRQTKKANEEYVKANEARKKRNALAMGKNHKLSILDRLDDLIQFKTKDNEKEKKARWASAAGGITGATTGAGLGAYVGAAHPETLSTYTGEVAKSMSEKFGEGLASMRSEMGEGWKHGEKDAEAFGTGAFTAAERDARLQLLRHRLDKRLALRRIGKFAGIGAVGLGSLGALGGYAAAKGGIHGDSRKNLSAKLTDLINFQQDIQEGIDKLKEHAKREATKTALEKVYEKLLESEKLRFTSRLDGVIEFQDDRPRSPVTGEFQQQGEGGPSPNAMATVYKTPQQEGGVGVGKAAGAALAGGALGAIGSQAGKEGWQKMKKLVKHLASRAKASRK